MTQATQGIQASATPLPRDRHALLQTLLSGVERIAPVIEQHKTRAEQARTLAPEVVEAMRDAGLLMMKSPYEVGGAEIHPVDQMEVVEAVTYLDSAAAWSMFIAATVTGRALSALSDEAVDELFAGGVFPIMAGSLKPSGAATQVDGGFEYLVNGHGAAAYSMPTMSSCRSSKTIKPEPLRQ